ncbi:gp16 family protein [Edwardsiella anguillarum]|uniref:gp16 family protein n=1 Tax=Edwardsiella anguillarum TaxID=1821960 RepID=UPI0024B6879A|nr:regulatory protein GemA [Edwardsiella anguillarum]WHQ26761.1 regulatory protein GemA [Edwardsiella anguillarum]
MQRASLIKLIHIARRDLHLDEDTYRAVLMAAVPGKQSCRDMTDNELKNVLDAFNTRGFKPHAKPPLKGIKPATIPAKIRAIWRTMHDEGFIKNGDEVALNAWIKRTTATLNGGLGVAQLAWLNRDSELAAQVLESLKKWHRRCMLSAMPQGNPPRGYDALCRDYLRYRATKR